MLCCSLDRSQFSRATAISFGSFSFASFAAAVSFASPGALGALFAAGATGAGGGARSVEDLVPDGGTSL